MSAERAPDRKPGLHVYCITGADARADEARPADEVRSAGAVRGVGGGPVESVVVGSLRIRVGRLEGPPEPSVEALRAHHRVVEEACARGPCLPHRFGSWFAEESRLVELFRDREDELREGLRRVAGCVEFSVRIVADRERGPRPAEPRSSWTDTGPDAGPGTKHLLRLARREAGLRERSRRAEEISQELESRLEGLLRAVVWEPLEPEHGVAALAHLVPHESAAAYRERVGRWAGEREDLEVARSGPWPPYSFTP